MKTLLDSHPMKYALVFTLISTSVAQTQSDLSNIRQKATFPPVNPSFLPVAISYQVPGTTEKKFYCLGSLYDHKVYGSVILTSEYIARRDLVKGQILYADHLSERMSSSYPTMNLGRIAMSSGDFNSHDANVYKVVDKPVVISPATRFQLTTQALAGNRFYGKYPVGKKSFLRLRSLVTGIYYDIIGYCNKEITLTDFVMISAEITPYEIGMALEDDDLSGIYIVHGSPNAELMKTIIAEYKLFSGISIKHVAFVSGPLPLLQRVN